MCRQKSITVVHNVTHYSFQMRCFLSFDSFVYLFIHLFFFSFNGNLERPRADMKGQEDKWDRVHDLKHTHTHTHTHTYTHTHTELKTNKQEMHSPQTFSHFCKDE